MKPLLPIITVGIVCAGCGNPPDQVEITESREAGPHRPPPREMTSAERFGFAAQLPPGHPPIDNTQLAGSVGASSRSSDITWDVPDGWVQGAPRPMRVVTFHAGGNRAIECYVSEIGGRGGGIEANLNRWCGQMGKPPLKEDAIQQLPRITVLGQSAPLLSLRGDYQGMRGDSRKNSLLLGTIAITGAETVFVKMIGPEARAEDQREAFVAFCESLEMSRSQNTL